jgi:peptidoglycan L-alanyl-D-glutamate endopeptidase CwlK
MYAEYFKRIDTSKIYPQLMIKLEKLIENCLKRGVAYYAISGFRSWEEQDALYAQGRDKAGKVVDKSKVVTNAKGGQSNHNYTCAVDFCKDGDMKRDGLQPSWDLAGYKVLAEEAEKLGLEAGLHWKFVDAPHIQLNLGKHGLDFPALRAEYLKNKSMADVWALLDKQSW